MTTDEETRLAEGAALRFLIKGTESAVVCALPDGADIEKQVTGIVREPIGRGRLHGAALKDGLVVADHDGQKTGAMWKAKSRLNWNSTLVR